jgi:hypothetical protein
MEEKEERMEAIQAMFRFDPNKSNHRLVSPPGFHRVQFDLRIQVAGSDELVRGHKVREHANDPMWLSLMILIKEALLVAFSRIALPMFARIYCQWDLEHVHNGRRGPIVCVSMVLTPSVGKEIEVRSAAFTRGGTIDQIASDLVKDLTSKVLTATETALEKADADRTATAKNLADIFAALSPSQI